MNWYIGQRIVAIKDHSQGKFKKGDEFVIQGLRLSPCACCRTWIDVGFGATSSTLRCGGCGNSFNAGGSHFFADKLFAPIEEAQDISELTEIISKGIETEAAISAERFTKENG